MVIQSTSNERNKKFAKLKQKKYRDEEGLFIVESIDLVNAALNRKVVKTILTTDEKYINNDVEVIYVTDLIIEKAKSLLLNTNWSVKEIGASLEFGDFNKFLKFFKYHTGKTPSEYRNSYSITHMNKK